MLSFAFLCIALVDSRINNPSQAWEEYFDHYTFLRPADDYRLYWKLMDNETVEIGLEVETTGWVGFGISDDKTMAESDIIIGWIDDNNKGHLQRRHSVSLNERYPVFDEDLSADLIAYEQLNGITRLHFERELFPCADDIDPFIKQIVSGTTFVIFAYNNADPVCTDIDDIECNLSQHDMSSIGSQSINFISGTSSIVAMPETYDFFDFKMENYSLRADDTIYHCKFIELPQEITNKSHLIRFDPVIEKGNEAAVHHMILYWCHDFDTDYLGFEDDCDSFANMPDFGGKYCKSYGIFLAGWAVGAGDFYFPEHVGYPIEGKIYALLEIHYDNPDVRSDIVDSSGMRMYWTDELREYEAGVFGAGAPYESTFIPGDFDEPVLQSFHSPPECSLNSDIDPIEGINLFVGILHAHTIAVSMKLRHIRNNIELPPILQNDNYDFNYQQWVTLKNEVKVYPGDEFICECSYNPGNDNRVYPTYGGESTRDEMCACAVYYYPATDFYGGGSIFTEEQYEDFFQTAIDNEWFNGTTDWYNNSINGDSFYYNGTDPEALAHYRAFQETANRTAGCPGCPNGICQDYKVPESREGFVPLPEDDFGDCSYVNGTIQEDDEDDNTLQDTEYDDIHNEGLSDEQTIIIISVAVGFVILSLIAICIFYCNKRKKTEYNNHVDVTPNEIQTLRV